MKIEKYSATQEIYPKALQYKDYDENVLSNYVELMIRSGLIKGVEISIDGAMYKNFRGLEITQDCYDFIETIRDNSAWGKIKNKLRINGDVTINLFKIL